MKFNYKELQTEYKKLKEQAKLKNELIIDFEIWLYCKYESILNILPNTEKNREKILKTELNKIKPLKAQEQIISGFLKIYKLNQIKNKA